MPVTVTFAQFEEMFPRASTDALWRTFERETERFEINTPARAAAFYAQLCHESNGLARLVENLNYTPGRLQQVFPSRFKTRQKAVEYARKGAEAIANYVYSFKIGNGSEASGDGWRYRGSGWIQLTGKDNYREFAAITGIPLESQPERAREPETATVIACAFWKTRGCNELADLGSFEEVTARVNGKAKEGLVARTAIWAKYREILSA